MRPPRDSLGPDYTGLHLFPEGRKRGGSWSKVTMPCVHPGSLRQPGHPCEGRGGEVSTLPSLADILRKVMATLWGPSLEAEDGGAVQSGQGQRRCSEGQAPHCPSSTPGRGVVWPQGASSTEHPVPVGSGDLCPGPEGHPQGQALSTLQEDPGHSASSVTAKAAAARKLPLLPAIGLAPLATPQFRPLALLG